MGLFLAISFAALWLVLGFSDRSMPLLVKIGGPGSMALGYLAAWSIPTWFKYRHTASQNRLLDRCRALLIVGSRALVAGNKAGAYAALARIRRLEGLWRIGNSVALRASLAFWAVTWAFAVCVLVRFAGRIMVDYGWTGQIQNFEKAPEELHVAFAVSVIGAFHALFSYLEAWSNPWAIDNCGDRLWQLMHSPRSVSIPAEPMGSDVPSFDGMTALEIFSLSSGFTRRELNRSRRRLAQQLHPDRFHASPSERKLREDALKRVNAAYDALRRQVE